MQMRNKPYGGARGAGKRTSMQWSKNLSRERDAICPTGAGFQKGAGGFPEGGAGGGYVV